MVFPWFSYGFPPCLYSQHGHALSSSAHPTLHAAPGPRRDAVAASSPAGGELRGANPSYRIVDIYIYMSMLSYETYHSNMVRNMVSNMVSKC